jgi:hypothetical protein
MQMHFFICVNLYTIKSSAFFRHELATESRNENVFSAFLVQIRGSGSRRRIEFGLSIFRRPGCLDMFIF